MRAASNAYLAGAGYDRVGCQNCGAVLKVPTQLRGRVQACPRCGAKSDQRTPLARVCLPPCLFPRKDPDL